MGVSHKISKQNFFSALLEISNVSEFNPFEVHRKHRIANAFTTVCVELGYVQRTAPSKAKWIIMRQPLMSDVILIKKRMRARSMERSGKQKIRQNTGQKQLTITPVKQLKRVASLVEPPAPTIDMHEESQLTWIHLLIIFTAGIIAGGLIATIWK